MATRTEPEEQMECRLQHIIPNQKKLEKKYIFLSRTRVKKRRERKKFQVNLDFSRPRTKCDNLFFF